MSQDHSEENTVHAEEPSPSAPEIVPVPDEGKAEPRPAGGFAAGLMGGGAAALVMAAVIATVWLLLRDQLPGADGARIARLEQESGALSQKMTQLQGQTAAPSDDGAMIAGLNQRLSSVEQRLSGADEDPRLAALSKKMDGVHDDVEKLRNAIPPEGLILRLAERAESAEKAAREISSQHAQAQALLLVVGQLRDAVDRGDPYEYELHAVRRVAPPEEEVQLDALEGAASTGLPRRAALLNSLTLLAPTILRAGVIAENGSIWRRAAARLASLVTVRRIDGTGDDTASVLARAQTAARDDDLAKAVQELSALGGAPSEVAAPWIRDARARITVDKALSMLSADVMAISGKPN